jgi:hypothetical protein
LFDDAADFKGASVVVYRLIFGPDGKTCSTPMSSTADGSTRSPARKRPAALRRSSLPSKARRAGSAAPAPGCAPTATSE